MSIFKKLFGQKGRNPAPLSFRDYAERYANVVRVAHPGVVVVIEHADSAAQTRIVWTAENGFRAHQFIGNWYSRYLQQPEGLDALLEGQLDALHASLDAPRSGLDCILPVIKTVGWQQVSTAQLDEAEVPPESRSLSEPFVGDLVVAYVEDAPEAMSYITASRLESLGLNMASLQTLALDNLARHLPELQVKGGGGRYAARLDRNYDASMILLFSRWCEQMDVPGEPVVVIAARDDVLVCGSHDRDSLASLRTMASQIKATSPYALSDQLFVWRAGRLQEYTD